MAHPKIEYDYTRAEKVLSAIYKAYEKKLPPFDTAILPQRSENLPKSISWGSKEHAVFLFDSCQYMRGRIGSEAAIKGMTKLYNSDEKFFDSHYTHLSDEEELADLLTNKLLSVGLGFNAEQIAKHWIKNKRKLFLHWGGDPIKLFDGVTSFEEATKRIKNFGFSMDNKYGFYGFREKMVSMIAYFYTDAGIIKPFKFPPPIDFHILRVLVSHRILFVEDHYPMIRLEPDKLRKAGLKVLLKWIKENENVDPVLFANAIWLISRDFCDKAPGNLSTPIDEEGVKRGRQTKVIPKKIKMTKTRNNTYSKTCGLCPIRDTCMFSVPSAVYYINGLVEIRKKPEFPLQIRIVMP